jgi:cellulose synthase/poly-beta-1,6-N-acetylglucosamine synthase-like glycosyltransferase
MVWFIFLLAAGFLWLGLHPFTTYPLSLWIIRPWHRRGRLQAKPESAPESFALCFCAYNEERDIGNKVQNCLALRRTRPELEILAYVDAASDRTAEILQRHAGDISLHVSSQRLGKTHGMNQLIAAARASILVFTDANVILDPDALVGLERYFADPDIGCVCGHLRYVNPDASVTAALGALYWRFEERLKQLESDTGSAMGADGSLFAIRRSLARQVPPHLIDDMFVSLSILCDGFRVIRAGDVVAREFAATAPAEEFRRKARIACQAFNVHRRLWPRLRRLDRLTVYKYVSHKLLRWFSLVDLALGAVFFELGLVVARLVWPAAAVAAVAGIVGVLGYLRWGKWPSRLWAIASALAGTALGLWYSLSGADFQVWTPAQSARD